MTKRNVDNSENFIADVDETRLFESADWLMKAVEDDLRLIAWISWCLDLLFKDFDYEQMLEFIDHTTNDELKKYIRVVDVTINDEDKAGVILDKHFELMEDGVVTSFLNVENQLYQYPYSELQARGFFYLCSIVFWEKGQVVETTPEGKKLKVDSKHYRRIVAPTTLWIFPDSTNELKNTVDVFEIFFPQNRIRYSIDLSGDIEETVKKSDFDYKSRMYFCYLGDSLEIDFKKNQGMMDKIKYLLLLLDLHFSFDAEAKERLKLAGEVFNLRDELTKKTINTMSAFELYTEKREKEAKKKNSKEVYERALKMGFDEKTAHTLAYGD